MNNGTTGAYPQTAYQTTTTYVPPPVVVSTPPKKTAADRLPVCICVCFMLAIIFCMSFIAFPGTSDPKLYLGEQRVTYYNGNFISDVKVSSTTSFSGGAVTAYTQLPPRTATRSFSRSIEQYLGYREYMSVAYRMLEGSYFGISASSSDSCLRELYVIRGESRYNSWVLGSYVSTELLLSWTNSVYTSYYVDADDDYYLIIYNPSSCYSEVSFSQDVSAVAYDTNTANYRVQPKCTSLPCNIVVPYPEIIAVITDTPTSGSQDNFVVSYSTLGRWYTYTSLYVGLFLGLVCCTAIASSKAKKKREEAMRNQFDVESTPILDQQQQPQYTQAPQQQYPQQQYSQYPPPQDQNVYPVGEPVGMPQPYGAPMMDPPPYSN